MSDQIPVNLRAALAYAEEGWRVFPTIPGEKQPLGRLVPRGCKDASTDGDALLRWWGDVPEAGVAIATGAGSGLWVLDIDGPVGAVNWWHWEAKHGPVHTLAQRTGRSDGGRQLFFRWPDDREVKNRASFLPGLDVRGEGGYVVAPPSMHPGGRRYVWEGHWKGRVEVAQAPDDLLRLIGTTSANASTRGTKAPPRGKYGESTAYGSSVADSLECQLAACGQGGRDNLAYRIAVRLMELELGGELQSGETERVLRSALRKNGYLDDQRRDRGERGFQRILHSASRKAEPKGAP